MSDFTKEFIESQKIELLKAKQKIIDDFQRYNDETKILGQEKASEEGDIAQKYLDQKLNISLREKDIKTLREIDIALRKINDGTYGYCEESEEPIEMRRLIKQSWARLSLQYAEELEKELKQYKRAI